jgi:hypothetical protein
MVVVTSTLYAAARFGVHNSRLTKLQNEARAAERKYEVGQALKVRLSDAVHTYHDSVKNVMDAKNPEDLIETGLEFRHLLEAERTYKRQLDSLSVRAPRVFLESDVVKAYLLARKSTDDAGYRIEQTERLIENGNVLALMSSSPERMGYGVGRAIGEDQARGLSLLKTLDFHVMGSWYMEQQAEMAAEDEARLSVTSILFRP